MNGRPRFVPGPCRFPGCDNPRAKCCRGWCRKHYSRWYRHGDPSVVKTPRRLTKDALQTLRERTAHVGTCIVWQGARLPNGYGVMTSTARSRYVHRIAWEAEHGPVPRGRQLHHTCLNKACCNPDHLVALTPREHARAHRDLKAVA